jgi:hypothetical protein
LKYSCVVGNIVTVVDINFVCCCLHNLIQNPKLFLDSFSSNKLRGAEQFPVKLFVGAVVSSVRADGVVTTTEGAATELLHVWSISF